MKTVEQKRAYDTERMRRWRSENPSEVTIKFALSKNARINSETKTCPKCKDEKSKNEFGRLASSSDGRQSYCKACCSRYQNQWRKLNPGKDKLMHQKKHLKAKYGMTMESKLAMFVAQGEACASCRSANHRNGSFAPDDFSGWCIDHDHVSGKVRGILCFQCNVALGFAGDSSDILQALAGYLDKSSMQKIYQPGLFSAF